MDSKQQHIFHSKLPDIKIPNHLPLHTYCFQNLSNHRGQPALINAATGETFTHDDVYVTARKFAAGLHKLGVRRRHVIMLLLHNSPEFAFSFIGASFSGAATTTANPLYTAAEIAKQAEISKPKLIVTHARYVAKLNRYASQNSAIIVTIDDPESPSASIVKFSDLIKADVENLIPPEIEFSGDDTAALPFSSGTTGLPKGVMLSHQNIVTCVAQQVDGENPNFHIDGRDLILCVLPLFHVYSLLTVLLCSLRVGASVLIVEKYEINELMEVMRRFKVTIAPFVPPILLSLAKIAAEFDLSTVRRVVCGAAPMDEKLQGAVRAMFPNATIGQGYGMTEAGVLTMCLGFAKNPFKFKPGSCGTVIRNAQMKVVDPSTGASLPRNQTGEICIRGPQVMKGYLNDGEATSMTIDKDGWLHTGDIGYVDSDDEVFIVDRLKELIKYKGFHVAPAQLEALLIAHPSISEAAVVPMKDEVAGEVPVAFVVKANGSNISEEEIKHYISNQVVSYKRINRVFFIEEIPKAPSGKILRKNLRARI